MKDQQAQNKTNEKPIKKAVTWWHLHRRLYDWVIHFADTKHSVTALFILSFAESSFFPVPPDVLLGPMTLGSPKKWIRFATACSVASILGGILGYFIGVFLWSQINSWVFAHLGSAGFTADNFDKFQDLYNKWDFKVVFTCGFTPLPYKVCTISAGIAKISFAGFLAASAISRSARFFLVAGLCRWKGETIKPLIEKYFNLLTLIIVGLLIGGFWIMKLLH